MSDTSITKVSEQVDTWVTRWSKRGALIIVGWVLANVVYGTQTLETKAAKVDVVQKQDAVVQKEAACEHQLAKKATAVAGQAIVSANVDNVPTPQLKDIPVDNCPHLTPK